MASFIPGLLKLVMAAVAVSAKNEFYDQLERGSSRKVYTYLLKKGGQSVSDVSRAVGMDYKNTHENVAKLEKMCLVKTKQEKHSQGQKRVVSHVIDEKEALLEYTYHFFIRTANSVEPKITQNEMRLLKEEKKAIIDEFRKVLG